MIARAVVVRRGAVAVDLAWPTAFADRERSEPNGSTEAW
jgi:hypothetical protein